MSLKLITAPASEPVTLEEAKAHLRADGTGEDALIGALIVAARQGAEHLTGRALMPQTWELALDGFPGIDVWLIGEIYARRIAGEICLPKAPLLSITSIKYIDPEGVEQTVANGAWMIDGYSEPGKLFPPYGGSWPSTRCQPNAVVIRYQVGYPNADAVPQQIKQWMLLRIGAMYEQREAVAAGVTLAELPFADRLLDAYRIWSE